MKKELLLKPILLTLGLIAMVTLITFLIASEPAHAQNEVTPGSLTVVDTSGKPKTVCPLKHTDVKAEISGFISRVVVTQEFENPFKEKIEAVYTFPLPQNAAVDDMTMMVGNRTVRGKILPREEAQAVYDAAKSSGQVASLLDQERPNIFTQSVANILPGEQVKITISYVETLKYENGAYEFVFPMVVGPRYIPGNSNAQRTGTDQVPDASRITPPLTPRGMRGGHDVSLDVRLDAGLLIDTIESKTHLVSIDRPDVRSAHVRLTNSETIPNKDFVLRYDVAGKAVQDALLTHRSEKGGFFTMILQPPERVTAADVTPKELVFVLDTSGSMGGFPIEKAKESMKLALDNLYPSDTFNLITFAGDTNILFPSPVPATKQNLNKAQAFLASRSGSGGTEMMTAIKAALDSSDNQKHVRIVCFMTDGYVGNDMEIISEVQKHPNARVFAFGIGNSVNRFLLDKMAEAGRGEVEYVSLSDDGSAAARRFHERVRNPLLTDISIDWNGLPVADVYPKRIPDLFGAKPVIVTGRFTAPGQATVRLRGKMAGSDFVRDVPVQLPETMAANEVLSSLWARQRIDDLMAQDYGGAQGNEMKADLKQTITQMGIEYRLMTQFTSFVAVEEMVVTDGGQPRRIDVPIEVPEGVDRDAVDSSSLRVSARGQQQISFSAGRSGIGGTYGQPKPSRARASSGAGSGGGTGVGVGRATAQVSAAPPPNMPVTVSVDAAVLSPEESKQQKLQQKIHPSVLAIIDRLKNKQTTAGPDEARFVRDGKAELQVFLTDKSDESLAKLEELGFEVVLDPKTSKLVIGRLPIEKLEALAELPFVRYVSPQMMK
jgi:Ca-activated chloride channel family protein